MYIVLSWVDLYVSVKELNLLRDTTVSIFKTIDR